MKYTDILIDLDDTLIDTAKNTKDTVKEVYDDYQLNEHFRSFDTFFSFYHTNVSNLWEGYNKGQVSKEDIQRDRFTASLCHLNGFDNKRIQTINTDYIERIMKKEALVDGAIELLDYLQVKYRLHILSNGFTEMQYNKMDSAGISLNYFDKIILSDKVGVNKPHPDIFLYSLGEIGATSDRAIMIGDNVLTDIKGAYDSNIDQIWYNPDNKYFDEFKPTYIVNRLQDIMNIL